MKGLLILLLIVPAVTGQTGTGSIAGVVTDAKTGQAAADALVVAVREGAPPFSRSARAGADGAFQVEALPAGRYSLCVQAGSGYLDPCQWAGTPAGVTLGAGQAAAGEMVRLAAASVARIEVLDAQDLLNQKTKDGRRPAVTLGVGGPRGLYYPARAAGRSIVTGGGQGAQAAHVFEIGVPRDTALQLQVTSGDLKLGDEAGVALPGNGSQQAFQHGSGEAKPKSFTFTVLGLLR